MKEKFKIGVIAGVVAALLALTINFVMAGSPATTERETVLQVSNLSCGACLKHIDTELRKSKGMLGMTADLAAGLVTVKHTAELTPERLAELVTGVGYPAKVARAAAEPSEAATRPGCKGCAPKDIAATKCNTKNCDVKDCNGKHCDPKNCDVKNCDKKNCDPKNCDVKNCDKKNCAPKDCDKKGCKLPAAEKS